MITDYEAFKVDLSLSKEDICRELYRQNLDKIRIKKEAVAVRNLVRIIDSTLRLANSKGFHAMTLRDLNRATDWNLPDDEANTVAGLVIHEAQIIPEVNQVFNLHGFRFEVMAKDGNRITKLKIRKL